LGDAAQINEQVEHYRKVTPDDIQRVAERIFREGNMNTLNYLSKKEGK
jgi:predicted Zn-dependent peptidase